MASDLTTGLLSAGLDLLAGGTPAQVLNAFVSAQSPAAPPAPTSNIPSQLPTTTGVSTVTPAGGGSGVHRATATIYVDGSGNIVKVSVHRRRRRRRALVTAAEIGQLEGLKAVLGKGALMQEWIATRNMGR